MSARVTHGACGRSWVQVGDRSGHCAGCHDTFCGSRAFDDHRRDGACLDPAELGGLWRRDENGQWRNSPVMSDEDRERLQSGKAS